MIQIFRGDDTDFAGLNEITITIETEMSLTGFTGCFCFLGVSREFTTAEIASKAVKIAYTSEETSGFVLGQNFGKFTLFDAQGRKAAVQKVLIEVIPHRMCAGLPQNAISIVIENQFDYNHARNKPKINGVEVKGDRTGAEYGLNKIPPYSSTAKYAVGDQVMHGKVFYECTTAIEVGEAWTEAHWRSIGLGVDTGAVHYTPDSGRSDAEQAQARSNIGAASSEDMSHRVKIEDLKAAITNPKDVQLAPAAIKAYLQGIYDAIQAL